MAHSDILAAMLAIAPPGSGDRPAIFDNRVMPELTSLTMALLDASGDAPAAALEQYRTVATRGWQLPGELVSNRFAGTRVFVTGGTGCIGTLLCRALVAAGAQVYSISRTAQRPWGVVPGVTYYHCDVRNVRHLDALFMTGRPHTVFHLAAQRDPGRAEREIRHTVTTNVLGTRNAHQAAQRCGAQIVSASTGKTVHYFNGHAYAGSKRVAEWLLRGSAARFTHIVDNSLLLDMINRQLRAGKPIRLHGADIGFYVQGAKEAVQLLLASALETQLGAINLLAIRDLGWPVSLLNLALGFIAEAGVQAPIWICGFDEGYKACGHRELYDPRVSGDVSALFNGMEARSCEPARVCGDFDCMPLTFANTADTMALWDQLERCCLDPSVGDDKLLTSLAQMNWAILQSWLTTQTPAVIERAVHQIGPDRPGDTAETRQISSYVRAAHTDN